MKFDVYVVVFVEIDFAFVWTQNNLTNGKYNGDSYK